MTDTLRGNAATLASCHAEGLADVHIFGGSLAGAELPDDPFQVATPVGIMSRSPWISLRNLSLRWAYRRESSPFARSSEAFLSALGVQ